MSRFIILSVLVCAAACAKGRGILLVDVSAPLGTSFDGIDHFSVRVTSAIGRVAGPYTIAIKGGPVSIPPPRTFSLSFDSGGEGMATVDVEADAAGGDPIANGRAYETVKAGDTVPVHIVLSPGASPPPPDLGAPPDGPAPGTDGGTTPGGLVLRAGGFTSGAGVAAVGGLRLRDDGFETGERACAGALCVTGSLTP
jgi:hypothetical protein